MRVAVASPLSMFEHFRTGISITILADQMIRENVGCGWEFGMGHLVWRGEFE